MMHRNIARMNEGDNQRSRLKEVRRGVLSAGAAAIIMLGVSGCAATTYPAGSSQLKQLDKAAAQLKRSTGSEQLEAYFRLAIRKQGVGTSSIETIEGSALSAYGSMSYVNCFNLFLNNINFSGVQYLPNAEQVSICRKVNAIHAINQGVLGNDILNRSFKSELDSQTAQQALSTLNAGNSLLDKVKSLFEDYLVDGIAVAALIAGYIMLLRWADKPRTAAEKELKKLQMQTHGHPELMEVYEEKRRELDEERKRREREADLRRQEIAPQPPEPAPPPENWLNWPHE